MSESASQRSGDASETSSQAADRAILKRRNRNRDDVQGEEDDLLEQRRSVMEGVFAAMYMLSRSKAADSWKFAAFKIVLEALIPFLVIFNPTNGWDIDTSNPVWQVVRWVLPRSPVARIWGYNAYIRIFYAIVAVVYIAVGCIAVLTIAMRKQEHSRGLMRFGRFLQQFTELVFTLAYMSVFDYMIFLFNCDYTGHAPHYHAYFPDIECLQTPHLIHMVVAGITGVIFAISTGLMLVAGCDLNPVARGTMASPTAVTRLRVLVLKALYVIIMSTLTSIPKVQSVAVVVFALGITYFNFTRLPFLRYYINFLWVGGWMAVSYTCGVFCYLTFQPAKGTEEVHSRAVQLVLYGVFPAAALGAAVTAAYFRYRMLPARKFTTLELSAKLRKVHKFGSPDDVEVVARCMRHFDTDGIILEETAAVGETVIKCGMALFPNNVELFILYANFLMEVKRDGPAARTQLQLALKGGPSLVQRYEIFSTIENSKRLKDGQEGQLDLQSYVEFKRNYRAVIRVHKAALIAQREFWQLMQRSSVRVSAVEAHLREMDDTADTAQQVYRRVLERYPNNGKLLRCYGKFLEDVRNDPTAAARAYTEAARNGGGDVLLSLDLQATGSDKPEFLTSMDLHEDACVVINAEGTILMVNNVVTSLLGYAKTELEGANVSMIMPQPFSGRHPSYLSRYVQGGEPHILDTVRDVVALHKERHVFPLQICVTKLSGVGTDAIFLGLLRPQPLDARNVRAWVAPNGVILCTDPQFASLTGMLAEEMVGTTIQTLCTDNAAIEGLLEICKEAPYEALVSGTIVRHLSLVNRHLPPVPVEIKVTPGGTDAQRIFVLNAHRTDGCTDGLMVVDTKGCLRFATWDVAALLGYSMRRFLRMRLEQLLPPPYAAMHNKHLRDHPAVIPPVSCRAGRVVHLVNSNGVNVPVQLNISSQDDTGTGSTKHIVQVRKVDPSSAAFHSDRRLVLLCTPDGTILLVDQPDSALFGFTASSVVGSNLADCIDVFGEWRVKAGAHQLELLLLALLEREMEMPGTSWRVKVHSPETADSLPPIDPRVAAQPRHASGRSACLQTELVDSTEYSTEISAKTARTLTKIVLWRRDLLTGVIELDSRLVLRRADLNTGLIVGLPPSSMMRLPLCKILNVPRGVTWEELMKDKKAKKSALKSAGSVVSAQRAFEGSHPDGGTMRIYVQGVSGGIGGRIYVTLHPDTGFQGARANVYRALGLEALMHDHNHHHHNNQPPAAAGKDQAVDQMARASERAAAGTVDSTKPAERSPAGVPAARGAAKDDPKRKQPDADAAASTDAAGAATGKGKDKGRGKAGPVLHQRQQEREEGAARLPEEVRDAAELRSSLDLDQVQQPQPGEAAAAEAATSAAASGTAEAPQGGGLNSGPGPGAGTGTGTGEGLPVEGGGGDRGDGGGDGDGDEEEWPERDRASDDNGSGRDDGDREASVSSEGGGGRAKSARGPARGAGGEDEEAEEVDPEHLHKTAHSQSEFVAQWVRTVARQMSVAPHDPPAEGDALPPSRQPSRRPSDPPSIVRRGNSTLGGGGAAAAAGPAHSSEAGGASVASGGGGSLARASLHRHRMGDVWPAPPGTAASTSVDGGLTGGGGWSPSGAGMGHWALADRGSTMMRSSRRKLDLEPVNEEGARSDEEGGGGGGGSSDGPRSSDGSGGGRRVPGRRHGRGGGSGDDAVPKTLGDLVAAVHSESKSASDNDGGSSQGDDEEGTSQGLGPGAFSDASSAVDVDLAADARRARLLKRLCKVFGGPQLTAPLQRMRYHTWLLLLAMIATHVVMYVVTITIIDRQFANVRVVHRLALAADRCQLSTVKVALAEFCSRPGVDPVSVCEASLPRSLEDLRSALDDLEAYHQSTYLGTSSTPRRLQEPSAFDLWTSRTATYKAYFDTKPPTWVNHTAGVWVLGNRFIATAREILYWGTRLGGRVEELRAYKFVISNGPWSLFRGYTASLDHLVNYAWGEVAKVQQALIVMLVMEAAGVQLACIMYELVLLRTVERIRSGGLLTSLAIPGPMLRVLANRPIVVVEDSDDEDAEDEDAAAEGARGGGGGDGGGGGNDGDDRRGTSTGHGGGGGGGADTESDDADYAAQSFAFLTAPDPTSIPGRGFGDGDGFGRNSDSGVAVAPRRNRRASMDLVVPAPGAVLPSGSTPYDDAMGVRVEGGLSYPPTRHRTLLPNFNSDPSLHFGGGPHSERVAPVESSLMGLGAGPGVMIGGRRGSGLGAVRASRGGRLHVNGKELVPSFRNTLKFMLPMLLWEVALVIVGAVSYARLAGMQGPLASLNMASHVIYRYTRVRMIALLLVSGAGAPLRDFYRGELRSELANLQSEYDTLMYGGLSTTQVGSVFQKPVPASTFESSSFANNFFRQERCFRWDQSKCYTPDSPYYEVTHHGLDVMLRRIISEMTLLASDDDADAVYNGTRYTTMYMVGTKDLYEGLQSSAQLFVDFSISRYTSIKLLQTILLIVTVVFFLLYAVLLLRPYTAAVEREALRLAGLLSHVPAEMDVTSHVRQVLRAHLRLHHRTRHVAAAIRSSVSGAAPVSGTATPRAGGSGGGGEGAYEKPARGSWQLASAAAMAASGRV